MARILVVEDSPDIRVLIRMLLEAAGHDVLTASDGRAGVDKARSERPDLVLMDLQLPEMDGLETTRRLLEDPKCKGVKVVAFSALAMTADRERALEAGCIGYITKPIGARDLIAEVKSYLK